MPVQTRSSRVKAPANRVTDSAYTVVSTINDGDTLNPTGRVSLDGVQSATITNEFSISKCQSNHNCKLCLEFCPNKSFTSSSTNRSYNTIVPSHVKSITCKSSNLIYLITCLNCGLQYVGETAQKLNARFNLHRQGIRNANKQNYCKTLCSHFQKGVCKNAKYCVNVVEKIDGDGRLKDGKIDLDMATYRRKKEKEWMLKLRTAYPFGLNDRIGDDYNRFTNEPVSSNFPSLKRNKPQPQRQAKSNFNKNNSVKSFLNLFSHKLQESLKSAMNFSRSVISSFNKKKLKKLLGCVNDFLNSQSDDFKFQQWYLAIIDIIEYRLSIKPSPSTKQKKPPKYRLNVNFINKGVEMINLPKILRYRKVINSMPIPLSRENIPMVTYTLSKPIYSKLFNHKKFVSEVNIEDFVEDNNIYPCHCENSPFKDKDHGHIITGDLRIVTNNKLRKIISKGPKYRLPMSIKWDQAKTSLINSINNLIEELSNKLGISNTAFTQWKIILIEEIDSRISKLKNSYKQRQFNQQNHNDTLKHLDLLHQNFVLVPIDKASNNIAFVCKKFYVEVLLKEFGILGNNNFTYQRVNINKNDIINQHVSYIKNNFSLTVDQQMRTLPLPYWLPKMHKTPIGSRFIIASSNCSIKPLSKKVTSAFKLIFNTIQSYHKKSKFYSEMNTFWVIQNNIPVLESIQSLNRRNAAKTVSTYDFSTLYTKIPHPKLIDVLNKLIDFAFKGMPHGKISISDNGLARWCHTSKNFVFNKVRLKESVRFLINNSYFQLGECLFQQVIGIPMGSDPAPFFANLFLFYFESEWMERQTKNNFTSAKKFNFMFRFIDDLIAINDMGEFDQFYQEIYPSELELKKETICDKKASFLDLAIDIEDGKFKTKLYDKRDAFPFDIVRMPFRSSNIPSKMFFSSFGAEILRISKATSSLDVFVHTSRTLIKRMNKQGAYNAQLISTIQKTIIRHKLHFEKFMVQTDLLIQSLFS